MNEIQKYNISILKNTKNINSISLILTYRYELKVFCYSFIKFVRLIVKYY